MKRLNLGCGEWQLPGYENFDRKNGHEIYPLAVDDGSVDEIRCSHALEHFSHRGEVSNVLHNWVAKLRPGGCVKIAVPDFEWIARKYLAGEAINVQGYTLGGHKDSDDRHSCIFDRESLTEIMANAGLERIGRWEVEEQDTASLPCSLNLKGYKPIDASIRKVEGTAAILSAPRFGPVMHSRVAFRAFGRLGIPYEIGQGAYWQQVISEAMEDQIAAGAEFILTCDYDSIFSPTDVLELYRLLRVFTEVDAVCAVQSRRHADHALFSMADRNGKTRTVVPRVEFLTNLTKIHTAHFGLTMFRASSLNRLPRPWMLGTPNEAGRWGEGHQDADIYFWHKWNAAGLKVCLANKVVIGHLQEVVVWPGEDHTAVYQSLNEFVEDGIPARAARLETAEIGEYYTPEFITHPEVNRVGRKLAEVNNAAAV